MVFFFKMVKTILDNQIPGNGIIIFDYLYKNPEQSVEMRGGDGQRESDTVSQLCSSNKHLEIRTKNT